MVMAAQALLRRVPHPTDEQIREAMAATCAAAPATSRWWSRCGPPRNRGHEQARAVAPESGAATHSIGVRTPLVDGAEKVTGRARYTADLQPGPALVGAIGRSTVAHARIPRIDASAGALALPGVRAVITGEDFRALR